VDPRFTDAISHLDEGGIIGREEFKETGGFLQNYSRTYSQKPGGSAWESNPCIDKILIIILVRYDC
jgi:hypothetical protein